MTIQIIETSQAPDAKPVGINLQLSTVPQAIVQVPNYRVPEQSFGGGTVDVPGVAEIISPLIVCNITESIATITLRMFRNSPFGEFFITKDLPVPPNDMLVIPLNGQFIYAGDELRAFSSANNTLEITLSYTVGQAEADDVI